MTEEEINRKAREIYTRCFDDVGEYVGVINALVIAVRETSRELEKENAELKEKLSNAETSNEWYRRSTYGSLFEQITKAKEIILRLYNAGRDVLMCRAEGKAYDNLSNAINDKSIEQFLKDSEVEK